MYDDTCRFLAEYFSADFASWLLGETVTLAEIQPSELFLDPIRAEMLPKADKAYPVLSGAFCNDSTPVG